MSNNDTLPNIIDGQTPLLFSTRPFIPTQKALHGIRFDFNDGARVKLGPGQWQVNLIDDDSGNILLTCETDQGCVMSNKKYFINFRIQVFKDGETTPVLDVVQDLRDKTVIIHFPIGTLEELLGWFPYAERFRQKHQCQLECVMAEEIIELLRDQYPQITFSTRESIQTHSPYASYCIGLFFKGNDTHQPVDFRQVGFSRIAAYILGILPHEESPLLKLDAVRSIDEPYVCIAVQSSCQAKYWNNGYGWSQVISELKTLGYRVLCIDKEAHHGYGFVWNHIPNGAEDFTGALPLQQRVDLLRHAAFFVGLSSGLSWLAWSCHIPVVLISGFTNPLSEFYTPWRVFNSYGCHGCWDDMRIDFDHQDFLQCPRHKGTERQYECSRLITGQQVIRIIHQLHHSLSEEHALLILKD
ncbi:adhesin-glycosylating O-heptosyltransferase EhaJ [Escherichia coli]|nr:adhesin-glycosylating O-heptosyltransferase EhaJ [Escherichia coli]